MNTDIADDSKPVGQIRIYSMLEMRGPQPYTRSYILSREGRRRTVVRPDRLEEFYPASYTLPSTLRDHVRFALKYEALDLRVINAALVALGPTDIENWVREEPNSLYSRRAWFFFERFSGYDLNLSQATTAPYAYAVDPKRHFVAGTVRSPRHHINDNLLGNGHFCPIVRRTAVLEEALRSNLTERVKTLTAAYSPQLLRRATEYLYTRETRSSFDIEGEKPGRTREERFLRALKGVANFAAQDKTAYIALQKEIVDQRFAAEDWREEQIYVGTRSHRGYESVHFIGPKPSDVPALMDGFFELVGRIVSSSDLDPVVAAAVCSFGFVFIHPFDDGNGRIHRFLIHHILTKRGFTPNGVIFPVSAAILRVKEQYEQSLDTISQPMLEDIEWDFVGDNFEVAVNNETRDLFRFLDLTTLAEFLYAQIADTITRDFKRELDYLTTFDAAYTAVQSIVDMKNADISLMVQLCLQNGGHLSKSKRKTFALLTDEEIDQIGKAIGDILSIPLNTPFELISSSEIGQG